MQTVAQEVLTSACKACNSVSSAVVISTHDSASDHQVSINDLCGGWQLSVSALLAWICPMCVFGVPMFLSADSICEMCIRTPYGTLSVCVATWIEVCEGRLSALPFFVVPFRIDWPCRDQQEIEGRRSRPAENSTVIG